MPISARLYTAIVIFAGATALALATAQWTCPDPARFLCYLLIAVSASGLKLTLPEISGTMPAVFFFILLGVAQLTLPETLALGCLATLVQCFWRSKARPGTVQILFHIAGMALAVGACSFAFHWAVIASLDNSLAVRMLFGASTFFVVNTSLIAAAAALAEGNSVRRVWRDRYFWSFPYYLAGAALAGLLTFASRYVGWQAALLLLPVIYVVYGSYRLYLGRLEVERNHVEQMAGLHLRTIEALALAIDAKDCTTHDHLRRVQLYAVEIGRDLGLSETELQALRAASVLHDIGKLAVPEHIVSKPGKLTPEEFEKMKIHPVVGAEILEQVKFPYPVVPIVRAHHEKWNGSGYPDGLKGEEIPLAARILAAVDCLDALASDRQYRRALPLDEAMRHVASEAGKSFDPRVVAALERRCAQLERMAQEQTFGPSRLSAVLKVETGGAPAAGFESAGSPLYRGDSPGADFLSSIASATQEVQMLFELTNELGNSLSVDETLSVVAVRLKRMVPYDCIAIYLRRNGRLIPSYVSGENSRLFSSREIPVGRGISGWVAENRRPIFNGNPSAEPGYEDDPAGFSQLRSALAAPLEGLGGLLGVLTLYREDRDAFTRDHLRMLLAITPKVALSIENALKYRQVQTSATMDALTALPNARSLFLHLDAELARSKRSQSPLAVLVCDLDNFKQVNDRFGHLAGNRVLRDVAAALKATCREYDYAARLGGDEFVLVMPGLKSEAVQPAIGRICEAADDAGRRVCGPGVVALSAGHALYPEDGGDAETLLAEADKRMYKTKQLKELFAAGLLNPELELEQTAQ